MSGLKLACSTNATASKGKDEMLECFRLAPKAGYRYWAATAPVLRTGHSAEWVDTERIRRKAQESGLLACVEMYAAAFPSESVEESETHAMQFAPVIRCAHALNCSLLVIPGGRRAEGGLQTMIAGMKQLLKHTEDRHIRFAWENHYRSQIESIEDYDAIFAHIPDRRLGIALDIGHCHRSGTDWKSLIRKYPDRIYSVHVKDHIGHEFVSIGTGEIDIRGLVRELHTIGYAGALSLEHMLGCRDVFRYISEAYVYLRDIVQEELSS